MYDEDEEPWYIKCKNKFEVNIAWSEWTIFFLNKWMENTSRLTNDLEYTHVQIEFGCNR